MVPASAKEGWPAPNGGAGLYSRISSTIRPNASPFQRPAMCRAKSIPEVTPPPVALLRSMQIRASLGVAP